VALTRDPRDYEGIFEEAWTNSTNTRVEGPPVDVNEGLKRYYRMDRPVHYTGHDLWQTEVLKAWRPDHYIPTGVRPESVRSWPVAERVGEFEYLARYSDQRRRRDPRAFGRVTEDVCLNHARRVATFLGRSEITDDLGQRMPAATGQPLFFVEHSVGGTENAPLNLWRAVHLTDAPNREIATFFENNVRGERLPPWIEEYCARVLDVKVEFIGDR
jgi:hypothetical protein